MWLSGLENSGQDQDPLPTPLIQPIINSDQTLHENNHAIEPIAVQVNAAVDVEAVEEVGVNAVENAAVMVGVVENGAVEGAAVVEEEAVVVEVVVGGTGEVEGDALKVVAVEEEAVMVEVVVGGPAEVEGDAEKVVKEVAVEEEVVVQVEAPLNVTNDTELDENKDKDSRPDDNAKSIDPEGGTSKVEAEPVKPVKIDFVKPVEVEESKVKEVKMVEDTVEDMDVEKGEIEGVKHDPAPQTINTVAPTNMDPPTNKSETSSNPVHLVDTLLVQTLDQPAVASGSTVRTTKKKRTLAESTDQPLQKPQKRVTRSGHRAEKLQEPKDVSLTFDPLC